MDRRNFTTPITTDGSLKRLRHDTKPINEIHCSPNKNYGNVDQSKSSGPPKNFEDNNPTFDVPYPVAKRSKLFCMMKSNRDEFHKAKETVEILFVNQPDAWTDKLLRLGDIQSIISDTFIRTANERNAIVNKFILKPPQFTTGDFAFDSKRYQSFIIKFVSKVEHCDSVITAEDHKEKTKALVETFQGLSEVIADWVKDTNKDAEVSFIRPSGSAKHSTVLAAAKEQMNYFIATLFYCCRVVDGIKLLNFDKWPSKMVRKIVDPLDISSKETLTIDDFTTLLSKNKANTQKERVEAKVIFESKIKLQFKLDEEEIKLQADDLALFVNYVKPNVLVWSEKWFKKALGHSDKVGLNMLVSIINDCLDSEDSILSKIIGHMATACSMMPEKLEIDTAIKTTTSDDVTIDVPKVTHRPILIEPPIIEEKAGKGFSPPILETGDVIRFFEVTYGNYCREKNISFLSRAIGIHHCLPSITMKNKFMEVFGSHLTGSRIRDYEDYKNFYVAVRDHFFPNQIPKPQDFEDKILDPNFAKQFRHEKIEDFAKRMKDTYEDAYGSDWASDQNMRKIVRQIWNGLANHAVREYITKHAYNDIIKPAKLNKLIEVATSKHEELQSIKRDIAANPTINYIQNRRNRNSYEQYDNPNYTRPRDSRGNTSSQPQRKYSDYKNKNNGNNTGKQNNNNSSNSNNQKWKKKPQYKNNAPNNNNSYQNNNQKNQKKDFRPSRKPPARK